MSEWNGVLNRDGSNLSAPLRQIFPNVQLDEEPEAEDSTIAKIQRQQEEKRKKRALAEATNQP